MKPTFHKSLPIFFLLVGLACFQKIQGQDDSTIFGGTKKIGNALTGKVYFLPENTSALPDFGKLLPSGTIYTRDLNISERDWTAGFPGISSRFEWFAIEYTGKFKVKEGGKYEFRLVSDDGSKLYIDDSLIINNDGVHGTRSASGSIELDEKLHSIKVQYFQGPRYHIALQLFVNEKPLAEEIVLTEEDKDFPYWVIGIPLAILAGYILFRRRKKKENESWIEVVLLDKDGKGVSGKKIVFTLPDGTKTEGLLDSNGKARLEGFKPGTCKISFSEIDTSDWYRQKEQTPVKT